MTDLKPQQTPTDGREAESPLGPPPVAADGGEPDADAVDGSVELTYDQRADAAAEAVRQVALHLRLMEE